MKKTETEKTEIEQILEQLKMSAEDPWHFKKGSVEEKEQVDVTEEEKHSQVIESNLEGVEQLKEELVKIEESIARVQSLKSELDNESYKHAIKIGKIAKKKVAKELKFLKDIVRIQINMNSIDIKDERRRSAIKDDHKTWLERSIALDRQAEMLDKYRKRLETVRKEEKLAMKQLKSQLNAKRKESVEDVSLNG